MTRTNTYKMKGMFLSAFMAVRKSPLNMLFMYFPAFPMTVYIFSATLSLALRALVLDFISSSAGTTGFFVTALKGDGSLPYSASLFTSPSVVPLLKKFFTILSSNEWYVITAILPPVFSDLSEP